SCGRLVARGDRRGARREGKEREGDVVPRAQTPRRAAVQEGIGPMICRLEPDVIRAAASGEWTASLRAHVESCADCAAAAEVGPEAGAGAAGAAAAGGGRWREQSARLAARDHTPPDPAVLWLKAKLMQSNTMMHRVALPITRLQIGSYLAVAACWAALLT